MVIRLASQMSPRVLDQKLQVLKRSRVAVIMSSQLFADVCTVCDFTVRDQTKIMKTMMKIKPIAVKDAKPVVNRSFWRILHSKSGAAGYILGPPVPFRAAQGNSALIA